VRRPQLEFHDHEEEYRPHPCRRPARHAVRFGAKKVQIRTDVSLDGAKFSTVKVDPLLIGMGIGYRF